MSADESSSEISEAAARWLARIDRAALDADEQKEFDAWYGRSPRHRGAYMRAQTVLAAAEQSLQVFGGASAANLNAAPTFTFQLSRRKALWAAGAFGAAAVATAASITFGLLVDQPFTTYKSERGEVRLLPMTDGSIATLNTDTEIEVRFTRAHREIHLVRGEALFSVAKDPQRPFTVSMGDAVVRAVGTSFVVRNLKGEPAQVLVSEGIVDMFRQSKKDVHPLRVPANTRAAALEVPAPTVRILEAGLDPALVARQSAWRQGMISFEGHSLKHAAAEFSRYSNVHIVIDDPAVADLRVAGLFSAYNPAAFAHSVAAILNLQAKSTPTSVMLFR